MLCKNGVKKIKCLIIRHLTLEKVGMRELGLDYVDLMLLHWPVGNPTVMWQTLEELYKKGGFRAIGVSNFYPNTFPLIAERTEVMPVVNQCETHVLYQQRKMLEYLKPFNVAFLTSSSCHPKIFIE